MTRSIIGALLKSPHLLARFALLKDLKDLSRLHFLYAALDLGLLKMLQTPATRDEISRRLGAMRPDLLRALLDLGVAVKELGESRGSYRITGKRARALAQESCDAFAAYSQEAVSYHGSVYQGLAGRIAGAPLGDYLRATAALVARSSRTLEPLMEGFVRDLVKECRPVRMLEIGCGSGIYLRFASEADRALTGTGIDMQEAVVEQARKNLWEWGIADRFDVRYADIRTDGGSLGGPFDLVTLYNNAYYFPIQERAALFTGIRSLVKPGGTLAVVSLMRGGSVASRNFDVVLRSTEGCAELPDLQELVQQLKEAGFGSVSVRQIMPSEHFAGVLARN